MKRGRPSDDYSRGQFQRILCERREALNLSLCALAQLARVNRGTLSQVMRGERPCGRTDRAALMHAVGLGLDLQEQFLPSSLYRSPEPELLLLDPPTCPHPPLQRGQGFLIREFYSEARREFGAVFKSAAVDSNYVLQADAAARMAWLYYEMDRIDESLSWVELGVDLIETCVGAPLDDIIDSVGADSHMPLCTASDPISHVLSRVLIIRCKALVERILYHGEWKRRSEADKHFSKSLALDEYLREPAQLGHSLRWQAVLLCSGPEPRRTDADKLLAGSRE